MKNGRMRQNRKKNSIYKKQKYKLDNAMKNRKLYSIKGYKFKRKIPRNHTHKKEKHKEKKRIYNQ